MDKKLYKIKNGSKLCGVCTGLAEYMGMDVTIIRLITVILTLLGGPGLIIYIIAAVVMPDEPNYIDKLQ